MNNIQMTPKVLVLLTGGTIGMAKSDRGVYEPRARFFANALRRNPMTNDDEYSKEKLLNKDEFVLPVKGLCLIFWRRISREGMRIFYTLVEYCPLKDSSNISHDDWIQMANDVKANYEAYDGFVILHGTDTMAYTSSALSFMLDGLTKPVVMTGARLPISDRMSNAVDNIVNAISIAAEQKFPEVTVFYNKTLYRGNRVTKAASSGLQPYQSPNIKPLLILTDDKSGETAAKPIKPTIGLRCLTSMSRNVGILLVYPGITAQTVRGSLRPPIEGLVLLTFGSGNCPSKNKELLKEIKAATSRGVIIVNCTQCLKGFVNPSYETGSALIEAGVLPGSDLTTEAALAKLSYVLGQSGLSDKERKDLMLTNIHGEMTTKWMNDKSIL